MQKTSVSRNSLLCWAEESGHFFGLDMSRISTVLLGQICSLDSGKIFAGYEITDEIKYLEGKWPTTSTPEPDLFKYEPLRGLHKKHFTSARYIPKNIINNISGHEGNKRLNRMFEEAANTSGREPDDIKFINCLAHRFTIEAYLQKMRDKSVTGEWIVFHKYNEQNYYLTLGGHVENDDDIYARAVLACDFDKFPFALPVK